LWPGPATIRNRGVVYQPEGIPFLVFADRQMSNEASGGGRWNLRLLCLDKQTGETVYRNEQLPDANVTRFRIRGTVDVGELGRAGPADVGERDANRMVTMHTNAGTIQLVLTDRPRPPRPPANDDLEAAPDARERGLVGLGEQIGAALRGTIEGGSNDGRPRRPAAGGQVPPAADNAPPPRDDD
jgi:hypothetical protein